MARTDLLQGSLDPLTPETLTIELQHGCKVSGRIRQVPGELLQVQQAELYPASQRQGRRGWICLRWGVPDKELASQVMRIDPVLEESIRERTQIAVHVADCNGQHP